MNDEIFSAVNVPVVGAYVFQTSFHMDRFPEFRDPEWQRLASSCCALLQLSELRHLEQNPTTLEETQEVICSSVPGLFSKGAASALRRQD